jgi:hypothetical protein
MIVYNETIKIDEAIHQEWLDWMKQEHLPNVMATGKFTEHRVCRLLHDDDDGGVTYAIQYFSPDMETFQQYQREDAAFLQRTHMERYRDRYVAFRTLMEMV